MKKHSFVCVAAAAALLTSAPPAGAEVSQLEDFAYQVSAAGFNIDGGNEMAYAALGLSICVDLFSGVPLRSVASSTVELTRMTTADAFEFVGISVNTLCPAAAASTGA